MSGAGISIVSAHVQDGQLSVVVEVSDPAGTINAADIRRVAPSAKLSEPSGRTYALTPVRNPVAVGNLVAAAVMPSNRFQYVAKIALAPDSDPPAYLLSIAGESQWFAPTSQGAVASDSTTTAVPRAGTSSNDYRGRDYDFFVDLMRARLANSMGEAAAWALDNAADPMTTMIEALAYAGDHLSFRQDAGGTESYLPTARRRLSLRRHARLRDYAINDGCDPRTVLVLSVEADGILPAGLSAVSAQPGVAAATLPSSQVLAASTTVYETMAPIQAKVDNNDLGGALGGSTTQTLPAGTITLSLIGKITSLQPGQLLVLRQSDPPADAPAFGAHVMRLLQIVPGDDLTQITWHPEDALPRPLTIPVGGAAGAVSLYGNVAFADHGMTMMIADPVPKTAGAQYRTTVLVDDPVVAAPLPPIASAFNGTQTLVDASLMVPSARACLALDPGEATLAITLTGTAPGAAGVTRDWQAASDLLAMPAGAPFFAATPEEARGSTPRQIVLRFGNGTLGCRPPKGTSFTARARTRSGLSGRVRAGTLIQLWGAPAIATCVFNPLPAEPVAAESAAAIRLFAASGFSTNARGITVPDWERLAGEDPLIAQATVHDGPLGVPPCLIGLATKQPADTCFEIAKQRLLDRAVLGAEPVILKATPVPLLIALAVYCAPGAAASSVRARLRALLGTGTASDGSPAYFAADNWPLGRSLVLSDLVATVLRDPGVAHVTTDPRVDSRVRFERVDAPGSTQANIAAGRISMNSEEHIRIDNDPTMGATGAVTLYVVAAS